MPKIYCQRITSIYAFVKLLLGAKFMVLAPTLSNDVFGLLIALPMFRILLHRNQWHSSVCPIHSIWHRQNAHRSLNKIKEIAP